MAVAPTDTGEPAANLADRDLDIRPRIKIRYNRSMTRSRIIVGLVQLNYDGSPWGSRTLQDLP